MSKRSRALKKARRDLSGRPVTKVRGPADTLALVPYLLGFVPVESLVVVAVARGTTFGPIFRLDLPDEEDRSSAADLVQGFLRKHGFAQVVVAVYSADAEAADPFAALVLERMRAEAVQVVDAFRGDGSRWWSYVCDDPFCCPAKGVEYDVDASPAAVDAVMAGLAKAPDREALRAQFEPGAADARRAVAAAVSSLRGEGAPLLTVEEVRALLPRVLAGQVTEPREQARLLMTLTRTRQRDAVWGAMRRADAGQHLDAWRSLMRLAPDGLLAPVGSLAAFAAWLSGRGVLASHAVERVLTVHPDYPMAALIMRALESALDPHDWCSWEE